ncbi:MAG: hemolysin III family protein [Opitutus sp.]|nr:hemolysin III family protein [Opitutus sp.]
MVANPAPSARVEEKFSMPLFLTTIALSFAGILGVLKLVAPDAVWQAQFTGGAWRFAAAFLVIHLVTSFIEYGFHRYVLHRPVVPLLSRFYRQHTLHHSLTRIGKRYTSAGREVPFVENIYPVTTPEQGEASFFPWYTLLVFATVVTPLLAVLQTLQPSVPWFIGGYAAVAFSMALYEIFHAFEHWSFERWAPLIEHRQFGGMWRKIYSFHLRHHAAIDCNEAISGFFTLPVFDWVFGTFLLPKSLYVDGSDWQASEFTTPRPYAVIRWCDEKADALIKSRRARAQLASSTAADALTAGSYTRGEQIAHYFTHGAGLVASVAALVLLVVFAALRGDARHILSASLFGAGLVALYAAFTTFRQKRATNWAHLFHRYNHAAVFFLIAGTATPFLLGNLRGAWGWSLFGVVWGLCLIGAGARLSGREGLKIVSLVAYLLLGVVALVGFKPLVATVPQGALWLLLAGGLCYACGTVFHLWQNVRYHQVVRHAFALGGSTCHIVAVLIFVLPHAR